MKAFEFLRPPTLAAAAAALRDEAPALVKAGGVDLLDRLKERVDEPDRVVGLVDVGGGAREIRREGDALHVGALATLAEVAASDLVRALLPGFAEAAGEAASAQIRNRATVGGNLAQHTRCGYYRHRSFPCLKRGDEACPVRAEGAVQEMAGLFDNGVCASAHPSSLAPVLGALEATVAVLGPEGPRRIPFADLWAPPRRGVASDLALGPADVIAGVAIPLPAGGNAYVEVRQKAAFDWPLVACAARLVRDGAKVGGASVWLGAVAPAPWRSEAAEAALAGGPLDEARALEAGEAATRGAAPLPGNAFKVPLVRVAVKRALLRAWERA